MQHKCINKYISPYELHFCSVRVTLQVRGRRPSQLPLDRAQSSQEPLHQPGSIRKSHRRKGESANFHFLFSVREKSSFSSRLTSSLSFPTFLSDLFICLHPTSSRSMQHPLHIHRHHFIIVSPFFLKYQIILCYHLTFNISSDVIAAFYSSQLICFNISFMSSASRR